MHPTKPVKSLFHPSVFLSTIGQAAIHLGCMWYAVSLATEEMGPERMKEILEFNKMVKRGEDVSDQIDTSEDPLAEFWSLWSKPFKPNLFNTVIFLVETSQMIAVLLVNYKGRPWMKGVLENHPLCLSLFLCIGGVATCAWSIFPELNGLIHLAPFPNDEFRLKVMMLVLTTIGGTLLWDRLVTAIFAPDIFHAMMVEILATRPIDLWPMLKTALKVFGGIMLLGSGNIMLWGLAFMFWRRSRSAAQK
jgi:cation-transporting ATPase 13A1